MPYPIGPLEPSLCDTMVDMTMQLYGSSLFTSKQRSRSFWYQLIPCMQLPIDCQQ